MESIKDLCLFIIERKQYWLIPVIIVLLILGLIITFAGESVAAPFLYSLF